MPCVICGAPKVNKSTCPFNPSVANPKPRKHNDAPLKPAGTITKIKAIVKPTEPQLNEQEKKQYQQYLIRYGSGASDKFVDGLKDILRYAFTTLSSAERDQYITESIALLIKKDMPSPVVKDEVSRVAKELDQKANQKKTHIKDKCSLCLRFINNRNRNTPQQWLYANKVCVDCQDAIGDYYNSNLPGSTKYQRMMSKNKDADTLVKLGQDNDYYNATMYQGAKEWSTYAARRGTTAVPNAPKGKPTF